MIEIDWLLPAFISRHGEAETAALMAEDAARVMAAREVLAVRGGSDDMLCDALARLHITLRAVETLTPDYAKDEARAQLETLAWMEPGPVIARLAVMGMQWRRWGTAPRYVAGALHVLEARACLDQLERIFARGFAPALYRAAMHMAYELGIMPPASIEEAGYATTVQ